MDPVAWFKDRFSPKQQGPKMTRSQQELQDFRNHQRQQVQTQVDADAKAGGNAQRFFDKGKKPPSQKPPQSKGPKPPKPTATPKAQNFLQTQLSRFGGVLKGAGIYTGVQQLRQGDATGLLTIAASAPKATAIATGLVLADQRPAGGAIYDENGNYLPGMKELNTLTVEQTKLKKELDAKRPKKPEKKDANDDWADPIAGKGPKGNEVGSDSDPDEPGLQGPADPKGPPGPSERTNENGIKQTGKSLSSANASLAALGIGPLQDAGRFVNGGQGFKIETAAPEGTKAEDVDFSTDDAVAFGMTEGEARSRAAGNTIETVITPTSAGTTGKDAGDAEEGLSSKPNNADKVRAVRFQRRDGAMSFNSDRRFGGEEPDDSTLTSPMYKNSARNAARSAFLDAPAGQGVMGVIRARDAAVGVHEDGILLNGTFRQWNPELSTKEKTAARYAATGGAFNTKEGLDEWTGQFLAPDSEAAPETAEPQVPNEAVMKKAATEFKDFYAKNKVTKK